MTNNTKEPENSSTPPKKKNPYEDADPIPTIGGQTHRTKTRNPAPTRTRTVQSAQDAARKQDREAQNAQRSTHVRPVRSATGTSTQRPARRQVQMPTAQTNARGYVPASTPISQRRPPNQAGNTLVERRKKRFGIIAASIIAAIVVLSAMLWWINRPVPITVNGNASEIRIGSTLSEVVKKEKLSLKPGNLVSVTDRVLEADMGYAFTASVNGEELSPEDADAYHVVGNESIDFSDGGNIVEEFDAQSEVIMPYLRMEGTGYSLQYVSQWGYAGELQHRKGKRSGETADVVAKEPQDCVITCVEPYVEGDAKLVALTFDDGPADPYTEQYLEILDRYGVKATFFNLGDNTENYPDLARKVVEKGHQLCNHTMAHNQLTSVDASTVYSEITRSQDAIEKVTGVRTTHIRPPYGDFTERSWLGSGGSITASIRWNGDSKDWETPGVDAIVSNSLINLHSGTIILMHDGGGNRSQDVEALPRLIEQVQAEGYEFVTISELMRASKDIPEDVCSGVGTMPEGAVWPEEIHPDDLAAAEAAASAKSS